MIIFNSVEVRWPSVRKPWNGSRCSCPAKGWLSNDRLSPCALVKVQSYLFPKLFERQLAFGERIDVRFLCMDCQHRLGAALLRFDRVSAAATTAPAAFRCDALLLYIHVAGTAGHGHRYLFVRSQIPDIGGIFECLQKRDFELFHFIGIVSFGRA